MILAYYNEIDKNAAEWLRQLIRMNLITDGVVDERSIVDVRPNDLKGFDRVHLFAGIGGWDYALKLAGWSIDRPVWTASLPCQPFSVAGKGLGKDDDRHLLPHFLELVRACKPRIVYGEQVPNAIKHGWLDGLCAEMGAENYTIRADVRTAAGSGAHHIRQRLYWVADSECKQCERRVPRFGEEHSENGSRAAGEFTRCCSIDGMANHISNGSQGRLFGWQGQGRETINGHVGCGGAVRGLGNTELYGHDACEVGRGVVTGEKESGLQQFERPDTAKEWDNPDWIYCRDEKYRPIKPGIKPLVDGLPKGVVRSGDIGAQINADETQEARVMRLKGYGNAIVPQVAAMFIRSYL